MRTKEEVKVEIISQWCDEYGFVGLGKNPKALDIDNGSLFTSEFYVLCYLLGIFSVEDKAKVTKLFRLLEKKQFNGVPIKGLYNRSPDRDQVKEQHDNYIGIVSASSIFGLEFHREVLNYGVLHGFCYNNVNPAHWDITCTRQGSDAAFYKLVCGVTPPWWEILWLVGGILWSAVKPKDTSTKILSWLTLRALLLSSDNPCKTTFYITEGVWAKIVDVFHGGMKKVFEVYFRDHPVVELMAHYIDGEGTNV